MPDKQLTWGMYGLEMTGFDAPSEILVQLPAGSPRVRVVREMIHVDDPAGNGHRPGEMRFDDGAAELWLTAEESVELVRSTMTVRVRTRERVDDDGLAHPYLGLPSAAANRWLGRQVLHGGAFLREGVCWGVLGAKEAGKSSTLGLVHREGAQVLSDDLLVLDGQTLFSGPRCVDLRDDPATLLGGEEVRTVGGRRRWRLRPAAGPPEVQLGGLVHLAWGTNVAVEPMRPEDRLTALFEHLVFLPDTTDGIALLELATLPTVRFTRPQSLEGASTAVAQLLAALS